MKRQRKNPIKVFLLTAISVITALLICTAGVIAYAYFSTLPRVYTENGREIARLGMNLSLLFDKIDPEEVADGTSLGILESKTTDANDKEVLNYYEYDSEAEWGTPENPYVLSELRHLQNLSVLQNIGYFDKLYISKNYDNGVYKGDGSTAAPGDPIMPYFLVCKADGTTVTIDGGGVSIEPIGNDEYPFIGYVGGAFVANTQTAVGSTLTSDTSAFYNIKVTTDEDEIDVGFFGSISYLGTEPEYTVDANGNIIYDTSFAGAVSTVRDILLADVEIKVEQKTFIEKIADHLFTYSKLSEADKLLVAHEDHHIGILAGHVEYATVELISVHYSSDDRSAIDLLHTDASYYSSGTILGFIYNMNPIINADGTIGTGSGTSSADIIVSVNGAGSGGGLASGTGRGYVTASEIFAKYSYTEKNRNGGQIVWEYIYYEGEVQKANSGILIYELPNGTYTLDDGNTPVTVELVSDKNGGKTAVAVCGENTWSTFMLRRGTTAPYTYYTYKSGTGTVNSLAELEVELVEFHQSDLMIIDGASDEGEPLCTEWIRNRIFGGTQRTGRYYFYDGVFTFCLSSEKDVFRDTWKNNQAPEIFLGEDDDSKWRADTSTGNKAVVTYVKPILGMSELDAAIAAGKKIFIANQSGAASLNLSLTMVSLANGSDDGGVMDNKYRMTSSSHKIVDEERMQSILDTLKNSADNGLADFDGHGNMLLHDAILNNELYIIDLGTTDNLLNVLQNEYQITAVKNGEYYNFYGYNINDGENEYLSLVHRNPRFIISLGNYYNIFCGSQADAEKTDGYKSNQINATVTYSEDDDNPYFLISFVNNGQQRYIQYDGSTYFNGAKDDNGSIARNTNARMYFYTVEGMHNIDHGHITFDPIENSNYTSFIADEAILMPNELYDGDETVTPTTYTLMTLEQLGWKNSEGKPIFDSPADLHKKFNMTQEPGFGVMVNLFGGSLDLGDSRQVIAPVGTNGVEANIPMGCVAFRVNTNEKSTVRVIIAVPVAEYYDGEIEGDTFFDKDYRFGIWQVEAAGGKMIQTFDRSAALQQFELPRSNHYRPGSEPKDSNYVSVKSGDTTYRCYLNGLRVLVGCEFTVEGEGVYIIGTTAGPMEIVHFSAGGTASAGRDGSTGSKLGSIDFVYDYDDKIVTVKERSNAAETDYSQYYASLCLLYTDITGIKDPTPNDIKYFKINDGLIKVRRSIVVIDEQTGALGTVFNLKIASGDEEQMPYIKCARYSYKSDELVREEKERENNEAS